MLNAEVAYTKLFILLGLKRDAVIAAHLQLSQI